MDRLASVLDRTLDDSGRAVHWPTPGWSRIPPLEMAVRTARAVRRASGHRLNAPIRDLGSLAASAGAEVVERDLAVANGGCEALLIPAARDRFRIAVDPTPRSGWGSTSSRDRSDVARRRIRFRVAHELGHTLFYARSPERPPSRPHGASAEEEAFCDRFARALLLPDQVFDRCQTVAALPRIQGQYDVSLEVTVRALAELRDVDAAVFYWRRGSSSPVVQWSNLGTRSRLGRWRSAVAEALSGAVDALAVSSAEAVLFADRRQAVIVASR